MMNSLIEKMDENILSYLIMQTMGRQQSMDWYSFYFLVQHFKSIATLLDSIKSTQLHDNQSICTCNYPINWMTVKMVN